jgi:hypothetical protein
MWERVIILVLFLGWLLYCNFEGIREAYYWYVFGEANDSVRNNVKSKAGNIHKLFTYQRSVVASMLCLAFYFLVYDDSLLYLTNTFIFGVVLILTFSFIHNGAYYSTRNNLDKNVYPKRFKDTSTTSTANNEFNYDERKGMFILGILLLIATIIKTWG